MKNSKKMFLLLTVVITAMLCFAFSAAAFTETGKCGNDATYTFNSETGELVISGKGMVWDFRNDADYFDCHQKPWQEFSSLIKKVVFKKGITYTGADSFCFCPNLEKVVFSDTVTQIAPFSFRGCENLNNPALPAKLQTLGQQAFDSCKKITRIVIPDTLTFLDASVFDNCYSLEYVYIGGSRDIDCFIFGNCPFRSCNSLERIEVSPDNIALCEIDGVLYNKEKNCLVQYPAGRKDKRFALPSSVKTIYQMAMEGNPYIEEIVIPEGMEGIGLYGISDCNNLKGIYYEGTQEQWKKISIETVSGYDQILNTPIYFSDVCTAENASKHKFKTVTTKATLTKNGKTVKECLACGYKKTTTVYYPKTITLSKTSYTYNGKAQTPAVTVKDSKGNSLKRDTDYTVKYESGRKNPGEYTVTITFKGKYSGTKKLCFTIAPKAPGKVTAVQSAKAIKLSWNKVTGADGYRVYKYNSKTGKYEAIKTLKATSFKVENLRAGTTYKFKVKAYKKDGAVTVWGKATDVITVATKPAAPKITKLTSAKGKASLVWSDVSGESGYQVYCSTKKDSGFQKAASYKAGVTKGSKGKLTSGKTYYFKVRAYKKTDSGTVYSAWSAVKSIKIK